MSITPETSDVISSSKQLQKLPLARCSKSLNKSGSPNFINTSWYFSFYIITLITSLVSAHIKELSIFSPENNGWTLGGHQYHFNWFDGDQLPAFFSESLQDESEEDTIDSDDDNEDIQYQHCVDC
ncbi:hypothetical protein TNIN_235971 [Trichonephila inaurata madagascariensis]|uniref:Uncharacterized protein n=1 Tax=Trichonephila inaurata madagascariensis TaxID=2747483 RepID=A0A8X6Y0V0_9ARAC|nr:hypothetical protein TNIN_235971 [Trichonephila inaurata madagascariensis]